MRIKKRTLLAVLCLVLIPGVRAMTASPEKSSVRVWEEPLTIPTYKSAAPDPTPLFYDGRTYQGAKGPFYPYPITDKLFNVREDKSYKAVYLENKYVKICVLPELGGRIFEAVDKANNYNFFYRQHVIKPALIGMLGAWISGGVEWNIPHHHRASSFSPVSYKMEENPDGSKTIWVGEMELRHRMRWVVGLTLYPDKSYLEGTVRLINRTPVTHSFLYFANVAVHTNKDYQVIFPPSCQFATQHSKSEFSRWPIGDGNYAGVDYKGVDCSWWKNHPKPVSMFAFGTDEDFLAGYDHGKKAGTLHVADHAIVPGKKFFTWGTGDEGKVWDKILTDTDGPYLELMVGGYSDNQPDYSWIQPYEVKEVKHCWYPFQQIGGVKNATREAAVNLEIDSGKAKVGFCATAEYREAKVLAKVGSKTLLDETVTISPGRPYLKEITLSEGANAEDLRVSLSVGGRELVAYKPIQLERKSMPSPVVPPAAPKDMKTNEELLLAGQRLQQFYSPAKEPDPYYEEALTRDPSDYRANVAMGILLLNRGLFKEAEEKLQTAVARATKNYTAPRDGEALYYLGLALRFQEKYDAAYDAFYKATWSDAWHTAGCYALAELACLKGDLPKALEFLDRSLSTSVRNTKALNLKSAVLRQMKRFDEAAKTASAALALDPLDRWAERERYLAKTGMGIKDEPRPPITITANLNGAVQSYLEIASDFGNAGLWNEGISVLNELIEAYPDKSRVYPMAYYWLGYLTQKQGKRGAGDQHYQRASKMPADYCFPFRLEEIALLHSVTEESPKDARAPYYQGNLLYNLQPKEAIKEWEKSRSLDDSFAFVHRNLGFAYSRIENDNSKAIASLEAALDRRENPRFLLELDQYYEAGAVAPNKRLANLEKHHKTALERDDVLSREIRLDILMGKYDKALGMLSDQHWNVWEGGASVHDLYVDALLLRGQQYVRSKKYAAALKDYEAALEYPENFSVGKPYRGDKSSMIHYFIGTAQEALGDAEKAKTSFQKSVADMSEGGRSRRSASGDGADMQYCQARALEKLERKSDAARIYDGLIRFGQQALEGGGSVDFFAKFGERQSKNARLAQARYALGLGYLGIGKQLEAKAEFEKALELNANHLGATVQLAALGK
jgi:tetratricopeptide (TPR) repeat protein